MHKEPTDFHNLSWRDIIFGAQNVILYYKIDTVIQLFRCLYIWLLAQGLYKTRDLFSVLNSTWYINPWKIGFCTQPWGNWTLVSQEWIKIKKNSLGPVEYATKIWIICLQQEVWKWPGRTIGTFNFACRSGVNMNPCISVTNKDLEKIKKSAFSLGS